MEFSSISHPDDNRKTLKSLSISWKKDEVKWARSAPIVSATSLNTIMIETRSAYFRRVCPNASQLIDIDGTRYQMSSRTLIMDENDNQIEKERNRVHAKLWIYRGHVYFVRIIPIPEGEVIHWRKQKATPKGVLQRSSGKYVAYTKKGKGHFHLGTYDTEQEAVNALEAWKNGTWEPSAKAKKHRENRLKR